jgi:hypothetical protein
VVLNDDTLRFRNQYFQLDKRQPVRVGRGSRVLVEKRLDGTLHLVYKGQYLGFRGIAKPAVKANWAYAAAGRVRNPFRSRKKFIERLQEKRGRRQVECQEEDILLAPAFV